jgi:polysaccharide pyruvyl transferase WcaK-like protein
MVNVILTQQGDIRNIGEHALLKSELALLNEIFPGALVSVLTLYPERLRKVEPNIEVFSPLIDLQVGNQRKSPLLLYPFLLFAQSLLTLTSLFHLSLHLKPFYRANVVEKFRNADLVVSGGTQAFMEGSVYQKNQSMVSWTTNLFMLYWGVYEVFITKKVFKKKFLTFPQSIGPFKSGVGKFAINYIINNADAVMLREDYSVNLLKGITNKKLYVAADMAFLFSPLTKAGRQLKKPVIGVSPCFPHSFPLTKQEEYVTAHSNMLDYFIEKHDVNVVFLPSVIGKGEAETRENASDDLAVCNRIVQNMRYKGRTLTLCASTADEFVGLVAQLDLLVATRMHPSILAAITHVPFAPIIYEHKQKGLLKKLNFEYGSLDVNEVTYEKLLLQVEEIWANREQLRRMLKSNVSKTQEATRRSVKQLFLSIFHGN